MEVQPALCKSSSFAYVTELACCSQMLYFPSILLGDTDILSEFGAVAQVKVQNDWQQPVELIHECAKAGSCQQVSPCAEARYACPIETHTGCMS